jgi:hypothetical protein
MKKRYILILLIISIISCSRNDKNSHVDKFVLYGYLGFDFIDSTKYIFDSTKLNIRQYFEIEKDSLMKICKGWSLSRFKTKREYFTIRPSSIIGLQDSIDRILTIKIIHKDYLLDRKTSMYNGLYYTLYYRTTSQKEYFVHYIPNNLPDSLRKVHDYIIRMIRTSSSINNKGFELNKVVIEDALNLFKICPPPPPPSLELK